MELDARLAQVAHHCSWRRPENGREELLGKCSPWIQGHETNRHVGRAQSELADLYAAEHKNAAAQAEYEVALKTVRDARCSVQREELRLPFFANATRVYGRYIDFLVQQGKTSEALKIADESRALTLAEGLGIEGKKCLAAETAFNPQHAARDANATILFYWLGAEHSYLWAVTPNQLKVYPLPPASQLDTPLKTYRTALMGSRDVLATGDTTGTALFQTLVAPAEGLLSCRFASHGHARHRYRRRQLERTQLRDAH